MRMATLQLLLILSLLPGAVLSFEIKTDRGLAIGGASLLSDPSASDVVSSPGFIPSNAPLFSAGLQRRYNLRELDNATVAAAFQSRGIVLALGLQQVGRAAYFAEKTARLTVGYMHRQITIAGALSTRELEFGSTQYSSLTAGALGVSLSFAHRLFRATLTADNLNAPGFAPSAPAEGRFVEAQFQPKSQSMLSVVLRARAREQRKIQYGLGQALQISERFRLLWGLENRPLQYGAGFDIRLARVTIIYGGRFHSQLGYTQQASVAYDFGRDSGDRKR